MAISLSRNSLLKLTISVNVLQKRLNSEQKMNQKYYISSTKKFIIYSICHVVSNKYKGLQSNSYDFI